MEKRTLRTRSADPPKYATLATEPEAEEIPIPEELGEMPSPHFSFAFALQAHVAKGSISTADPKSYKQAMARPDAKAWREAIDKEMNSLRDMGTLKIVSMQEFAQSKRTNPKLTLLPSSLVLKTK